MWRSSEEACVAAAGGQGGTEGGREAGREQGRSCRAHVAKAGGQREEEAARGQAGRAGPCGLQGRTWALSLREEGAMELWAGEGGTWTRWRQRRGEPWADFGLILKAKLT
jgi:hypothetical protein